MTDTKDIDFHCWYCADPFDRETVEAEGLLIPRRRGEGGPYLLYTCSDCLRKSRVEHNLAGVLLAGPIPIVLFDGLMAQFDATLRKDLAAKKEHFRRRKGRREWFFEVYEKELLAAGVRPRRKRPAGSKPKPKPRAKTNERGRREQADERGRRAKTDERGRREQAEEPKPRRGKPPPEPEPIPEPELTPPPAVEPPTPHELLGIEPGASQEEIRKAFRDLAKRYHPDKFEALDPEFKQLAHSKFVQLKAAMEELTEG